MVKALQHTESRRLHVHECKYVIAQQAKEKAIREFLHGTHIRFRESRIKQLHVTREAIIREVVEEIFDKYYVHVKKLSAGYYRAQDGSLITSQQLTQLYMSPLNLIRCFGLVLKEKEKRAHRQTITIN